MRISPGSNGKSKVLVLTPSTARVLETMWRHKRLLLLFPFLGLSLALALSMVLPRTYESTAEIRVAKKRPDAVTGMDTRQFEDYVVPVERLLKSSPIINQAIREHNLDALPMFADEGNNLTETIRKSLSVTPAKSAMTAPGTQTSVFKVTFRGTGSSPLLSQLGWTHDDKATTQQECQQVLTAILSAFRDYLEREYQTVSKDTFELILKEAKSVEQQLAEKQEAYRKFRESSPLLGKGGEGPDLRQDRLNIIQTRRSALLLRRVELEGQLACVEKARKEGKSRETIVAMLAETPSRFEFPEAGRDRQAMIQDQLFPLLMEEQKLLGSYGPKHPDVLAIRQRIEAARQILMTPPTEWRGTPQEYENALVTAGLSPSPGITRPSTIAGGTGDPIEMQIQLLKQKIEQTKNAEKLLTDVYYQTEQEEARRLANYEIQNDDYRTSINLTKQLCETLVRRLNDASLIRNVGGYKLEAIEPPSAGKKVAPNRAILMFLGCLLGGTLSLGMAYIVSALEVGSRVRKPVPSAETATLPQQEPAVVGAS